MDKYKTGSTFAGYTIEGLVAGGGMGQVYAARHDVYKTPIALKVLHPKLHADPSWMKRFSVEGLVGTRLKHPNVLSARELVSDNGRIALVMDLVSGGQTLEKVISREHKTGLNLVQGLKVFLQIVQGVEYLHDKAITHGDMKPENVMIEGDYNNADTWKPKVTDFGTVSLIADPVTIDGKPAVVATPRYAAPEHLYGIDKVTDISDIYAMGLVLHFILTAKHASTAKNVEEAARFVRAPLSVVALVDQPDSLIKLYQKACARDPEARYKTARELALAVRDILDEVGVKLELGDDLSADLATEIDEEMAEAQKKKEQAAAERSEVEMETELDLGSPMSAKGPDPVSDDEIEARVDRAMGDHPTVDSQDKSPKDAPAAEPSAPPPTSKFAPEPEPELTEARPSEAKAKAEPKAKAKAEPKAKAVRKPVSAPQVPAENVDPDAPMPVWLMLVIGGTIGFLLLVAWMNWT